MSSAPPGPDLTFLWGIVGRAVRDPELRARPGGVVQNVWNAYQQTYASQGLAPPRLTIQQLNPLISTAAKQAQAEINLAQSIATYRATGFDQALTAAHIAPDIDLRSGAGTITPAFYRVRFESVLGQGADQASRYVTWSPELNLPASVSGLLGAITEAGAAAAEDYGEDFAGLGDLISITAI